MKQIEILFDRMDSWRHLPYFQKRGWDCDLHMLNGKLFPFLEMNEGSVADYIDMQRLMFTINAYYRDSSFRVFGDTRIASAFRENLTNGFGEFVDLFKRDGKGKYGEEHVVRQINVSINNKG
jgi:hypothetical protein